MAPNVDTRLPEYTTWSAIWMRIRDVVAGEDAVKHKTVRYLPQLSGQTSTAYDGYISRAMFYNATGKTVEGLVGAVLQKPPHVMWPHDDAIIKDVTGDGMPLNTFAREVLDQVVTLGRYGVLTDAPVNGGDPYLSGYPAENIINWRTASIDGELRLTLVVLKEDVPEVKEIFETEIVEQRRVLMLVPGERGFEYQVEIWQKSAQNVGDKDGPWRRIGARLTPSDRDWETSIKTRRCSTISVSKIS